MKILETKKRMVKIMSTNSNEKERSDEMAKFVSERIKVIPYTEGFDALIATAIDQHGFKDELAAIRFLNDTGQLREIDIGGGVENSYELRQQMIAEFGCTPKTALTHITRAEMSKRYPDAQRAQWGGTRAGAGRPAGSENRPPEIEFEVEVSDPA